jgi:hypothetical protein
MYPVLVCLYRLLSIFALGMIFLFADSKKFLFSRSCNKFFKSENRPQATRIPGNFFLAGKSENGNRLEQINLRSEKTCVETVAGFYITPKG